MSDIFIDGIRSIAVANGVARIEVVQLRRGESRDKLDPEVTATLLIPANALKDFTTQLAGALQKMSARAKAQPAAGQGGDVDSALENL
jgi:hypothetical protein